MAPQSAAQLAAQLADLERQVPVGWRQCPKYGEPICDCLIPSKAPLGGRFDPVIEPSLRYRLHTAQDEFWLRNIRVGMIVDLTNTNKYYDLGELPPNTLHFKVRCKGKDQSPSPEAVNEVAWYVYSYRANNPDSYVLIHCTHGFNRTGYVISCIMARLMALKGMSIDRAIRQFATARPPGIYKNAYINDLFTYHHESRDMRKIPVPKEPDWKTADDDDGPNDDDGAAEGQGPVVVVATGQQVAGTEDSHIMHDELIGEGVHDGEASWIQMQVFAAVSGAPQSRHVAPRFPGSQPVSLDHQNMPMLHDRRYWVTWKADGTRFLVWIDQNGVYLLNRNFAVRRVQMRFCMPPKTKPKQGDHVVGPPHDKTLLDGEMVVDDENHGGGGGVYTRRFLAYDLMQVNGTNIMEKPFKRRYEDIQNYIVNPRSIERDAISRKAVAFRYDYHMEPFSVRRKEFWPLEKAPKLIHEFIPKLCHESDGLIFQGFEDPYKPNTCNELLKWKFSQHNSVDFKLECNPPPVWDAAAGKMVMADPEAYTLYLMNTRRAGNTPPLITIDALVRNERPPHPSNRVDWMTSSAAENHGKIVECAYELDRKVWRFMRVRTDKNTANASFVFSKVFRAIQQNIREEEVLCFVKNAFLSADPYASDRAVLLPGRLEAMQDELEYERQAVLQQQQHQQNLHGQQHGGDVLQHQHGQHQQQQGGPPGQPSQQQQQQQQLPHFVEQRPTERDDDKDDGMWSGRRQWRPRRPIPASPLYVPGGGDGGIGGGECSGGGGGEWQPAQAAATFEAEEEQGWSAGKTEDAGGDGAASGSWVDSSRHGPGPASAAGGRSGGGPENVAGSSGGPAGWGGQAHNTNGTGGVKRERDDGRDGGASEGRDARQQGSSASGGRRDGGTAAAASSGAAPGGGSVATHKLQAKPAVKRQRAVAAADDEWQDAQFAGQGGPADGAAAGGGLEEERVQESEEEEEEEEEEAEA